MHAVDASGAAPAATPPLSQQQQRVAGMRNVMFGAVLAVFALLGLLIAYNSGATAEENQSALVTQRVESVRRRLRQCEAEMAAFVDGRGDVGFATRKANLELTLTALQQENTIYTEQSDALQTKVDDCQQSLAAERRRTTGSGGLNVSDDILRLRYAIQEVEAAIDSANRTRVRDRRRILRVIEAYGRENAELARRVSEAARAAENAGAAAAASATTRRPRRTTANPKVAATATTPPAITTTTTTLLTAVAGVAKNSTLVPQRVATSKAAPATSPAAELTSTTAGALETTPADAVTTANADVTQTAAAEPAPTETAATRTDEGSGTASVTDTTGAADGDLAA
jgi:hypothetical protein